MRGEPSDPAHIVAERLLVGLFLEPPQRRFVPGPPRLLLQERKVPAWSPRVFFFAGEPDNGAELYGRMCAPAMGIAEDPATGAACAALVGTLADRPDFTGELLRLLVKQGVAMGRPRDLEASARKSNGGVTSISVGAGTAYVASGEIDVPRSLLMS
jgi:trans-2,3-dihydro-3-hydroxyanthranilate isomerase